MSKSKLSYKKEVELYRLVYDAIMDARIKIWKMRTNKSINIAEIDDILFDLAKEAPQKAIDCFKKA